METPAAIRLIVSNAVYLDFAEKASDGGRLEILIFLFHRVLAQMIVGQTVLCYTGVNLE